MRKKTILLNGPEIGLTSGFSGGGQRGMVRNNVSCSWFACCDVFVSPVCSLTRDSDANGIASLIRI